MNAKLLDCALDAVRRGFKVFPCTPKAKQPAGEAVPHGVKDATRDETIVRCWWKRNPNYNIGITGGVILDIDLGIHSLQEAKTFALLNSLPPTLAIRTGRRPDYGVQFHYSGISKTKPYSLNGVSGEVRSGNAYGIFAGSIHPDSGEKYEIVIDLPIAPWPEDNAFEHRTSGPEGEFVWSPEGARQKFEQLLSRAQQATPGNRNYTAHALTWFAVQAYLAGVFNLYDPFTNTYQNLTEADIKKRIYAAVAPHYKPGERDVRRMLWDSWHRYGLPNGPLKLTIYPADLDRLFTVVSRDSEVVWRLLSGVTADFASAVAARDHLAGLLRQAGFQGEDLDRVLRWSGLGDRIAHELLAELEVSELLKGGR